MATPGPRAAPASAVSSRAPSPSAGEQLRVAVQRLVRSLGVLASDRTPCGAPLSTSYAHALVVLLERGRRVEPTTQQELGETLGIDKSNVARLCARLAREGRISQRRSPTDGRARLLALTVPGRRVAERVETASRRRFADVLASLPDDGTRAVVVGSLEVLNRAIVMTRRSENPR